MTKVHLHTEQFDQHRYAWCGRSGQTPKVVISHIFEATDPSLRCYFCNKEWFPNGQPSWHFQQAVKKLNE